VIVLGVNGYSGYMTLGEYGITDGYPSFPVDIATIEDVKMSFVSGIIL